MVEVWAGLGTPTARLGLGKGFGLCQNNSLVSVGETLWFG